MSCEDCTILSGHGVQSEFNISLSSLHSSQPAAASTAVPNKSREEMLNYIISKSSQEDTNDILTISSMMKDPTCIAKNDSLHSIPKSSGSSSKSESSLFPNSSILYQSGATGSCDEDIDLKVVNSKIGLPPDLISVSKENEDMTQSNLWSSSTDQSGVTKTLAGEEVNVPQTPCSNSSSWTSGRAENQFLPDVEKNRFREDNDWGSGRVSIQEDSLREQQELFTSIEDEEFHAPDSHEFSMREGSQFSFQNFSNIDHPGTDLSGISDPRNISIRPSLIRKFGLKVDGKKPGIEELFKAKSCKFGNLDETGGENPSFGFSKDALSPPKYVVNGAFGNTTMSSTYTVSSPNKIPSNSTLLEEDEQTNITPLPSCTASSSSQNLDKNEEEVQQMSYGSQRLHEEMYLEQIRQMVLRNATTEDTRNLANEILECLNPEDAASILQETLDFDTSSEVLELRRYREQIRNEIKPALEGLTELTVRDKSERLQHPSSKSETNSSINAMPQPPSLLLPSSEESAPERLYAKPTGRVRMGTGAWNRKSVASVPLPQSSVSKPKLGINSEETPAFISVEPDVVVAETCVTGIKTEGHFTVRNSSPKMMVLSLKEKSSPDSAKLSPSPLFEFAPLHYLPPKSDLPIKLGFCSLTPCYFVTKLVLTVSDLATFTANDNSTAPIFTRDIIFIADIEKPHVEVFCGENSEAVNFELVPEGCSISKKVTLRNKSSHSLLVFIKIIQDDWYNVWSWECEEPHLKLISSSLAACEIASSSSTDATLLFKAPNYEAFKADGSLVKMVGSLEVSLDSPSQSPIILQKIPIEAVVGEVCLKTFRTQFPIRIESEGGKTGYTDFKFLNKSLFPLSLQVRAEGHDALSVSPSELTVSTKEEINLKVSFSPCSEKELEVKGKLVIQTEPNGMEMDVPLVASSIPIEKEVKSVEKNVFAAQTKISQPVKLTSNKSQLSFATVPEGESVSQNLILQNKWPSDPVTLQFKIQDCDAFYFENEGVKSDAKVLVIPPNEKSTLVVSFCPKKTIPYACNMICKPHGVAKPVKITFPLHGFGGTGEVSFSQGNKQLTNGEEISFGIITPGTPSLIRASIFNAGSRFLLLKLLVRPNEFSDQCLGLVDVCVQPSSFVLAPQKTKEFVIVTTGSPSVLCLVPGKIGVLQVVYVDEILHRRFKRLKAPSVNWQKVEDIRLMNIGFDDCIAWERDAHNEEDSLPLVPDDALLFYNGCRTFSVPLCYDIDPDADASTTMLDIVAQQETMTTFMDVRTEPQSSKKKAFAIPDHVPHENTSREFEVFPSVVHLSSSQSVPREVSAMNYTKEEQMLQVTWEDKWLLIDPQEINVLPFQFSLLKVSLNPAELPRNSPKCLSSSFTVLGKNERKTVNVEIEIDSYIATEIDTPTAYEMNPTHLERFSKDFQKKTKSIIAAKINVAVPRRVEFPSVEVGRESISKLTLKNFDSSSHSIRLSGVCAPFFVRHTEFIIKEERSVNVPLYFRPRAPGIQKGQLTVQILNNDSLFHVNLTGDAL